MDETRSRGNPFPGLRPFRTEEHHLFFGREEQTAALLALLGEQRFLAVVGTSGSGKSSLVRAGLIPALHRGTMARAGSTWEVVILRPGGNPVTSLARALVDASLYEAADPEALPRLRATLTRSHFGLVEAVRQSSALDPQTNLLVVVDQFEEVFRFREQGTSSEETASAFVSLLLAASEASERRIYIAITMRSDYLGDCANIPGLAEAVNRGEYLIPRLSRDQRREAIEKPVGVSGARMAPRLVQQMLNDLGDDPDQLPVLQHALLRTWDAWSDDHGNGEPIDLRHYEATGGMATALSRHADEVFDALPGDEHRSAAERVFRALTVKGADNRGIRRPTRLDRLARIAGASDEIVARVVEAYRSPGVTFLMPGTGTALAPDTVIDLSHESLMRVWTRLRGWVDEEAQSARIYRRLAETADLWKDDRAGLFRDPDLGIALGWREAARPTDAWAEQHGGSLGQAMEFLDRSRDEARAEQLAWEEAMHREVEQATALAEAERRRAEDRQRAAKRLKALAAGVAVVAVLALGAMGFAVKARREAVESAQVAKDKEALATQAAGDAERAAFALQRTLVESDFHQGAERIEAGEGAAGLSHLARALRADPGFWPAAARAMTAMASGRFPLRTFPRIAHEKVITNYWLNDKESLVFTTDQDGQGESQRFVWDARTAERLYAVAPGSKGLLNPEWTKDGKHLFALEPSQNIIRVWEARSGKELKIAAEGIVALESGVDPRGRGLLLGRFEDGSLQVWRLPEGEAAAPRITRPARATGRFGFTPDGARIFATYADATIVLWDVDGGGQVAEVSTRPFPVQDGGVYFTRDGKTVLWKVDGNRKVGWQRVGAADGAGSMLEFEYEVSIGLLPGGSKVAIGQMVKDQSRSFPFKISVYDLETRERVAFIDHPKPVEGIMTPREGSFLTFPLNVTREGNFVRVWDLESGALMREIGTPSLLSNADLSPDGRKVLTVSITHEMMLWDVFTGKPLFNEPIEHGGRVKFSFSPEGEKLVTYDEEKRVLEVWDCRTGRRRIEPTGDNAVDILFTCGGERLLLSNFFGTRMGSAFSQQTAGDLGVVDVGTRPVLFEALIEGSGWTASARWSPRGEIIVFGKRRATEPNQVMLWDGTSRRLRKSLPLPEGVGQAFKALGMSADGMRVIQGATDNLARVYDIASAEVLCSLAHDAEVTAVSLSSDGSRAATGTNSGKVRLWDAVTGAPLCEPLDHGDRMITVVSLSPDARVLASGSLDLKLRLADGRTGEARSEPLVLTSLIQGIPFSPDGSHLAAVTFAPDVAIVDAATGAVVRKLHHNNACRVGTFSPDGRILAVGTGATNDLPVGDVYLWEWREGRRLGPPLNARGPVQELDISRDGALLATSTITERGAVQVWDMATGQPLVDPIPGGGSVESVGFNGAGTEVVAAWEDGVVRVIDLPPRGEEKSGLLANLAEAVARRKLASVGSAMEEVPQESLDRLRQELADRDGAGSGGSGDTHTSWARWFLSDPETRPISPRSKVTFAEHMARLRRSDRVEDLQDAIGLAPSDGLAHARLSLVLRDALAATPLDSDKETDRRLRRHWMATADWYGRRSVDLAPRDADVWAHRSEGLRRAGEDAGANAAAARAHELGPGRPNAEYVWALALAGEGKWDEADASFGRALEGIDTKTGDAPAQGTGAPLLGPLASLEPGAAPRDFRELRLPAPIPGTFEDFESTPEGGAPAGWTARHERTDVPAQERDTTRIANADSEVFEDWIVVSADRVVSRDEGPPFYRERLLASDRRERLDGRTPSPLLEGRFIYSLGGDRESSFVHHLFTPDFDCTGRKGVHVAFRSAYEQAPYAMAGIEYSIDEGKTWLPVLYRLSASNIVSDGTGRTDAAATLKAPSPGSPLFLDEDGNPRGLSFGEFIGAPISRELDPYIEGLPPHDYGVAKRLEVFRLPLADGRPRVRLRFLHGGRYGWYWGIDDFGLHEIPDGPVVDRPDTVDRRLDPGPLAGLGLAAVLGDEFGSQILKPSTLAALPLEDREASGPTSGSESKARARVADGRLLLRRAAALAPDDPWILLASAYGAARGDSPDEALALARKALERVPPGRATAPPLAAAFLSKGDALERNGDGTGAAVAHELAHVLYRSATGESPAGLIERLARVGLSGKSRVVLARGSEWRFLDGGEDPGPEWKQPVHDDSYWSRGKAPLGYGGDGEVTTLSYGRNPGKKAISTYFRAAFDVEDPALLAYLRLNVLRDDGVVVYLNGQEVLRDNMPQGAIGKDTRAANNVSGDDEQTFLLFEVPAGALRHGRNVIAAEVHQQAAESSDLAFDLEVEGVGGLGVVSRSPSELEAVEERLDIPGELRGLLWASRAERFRRSGDLERATEGLERAKRLDPGNPGLAYERAHLLRARSDAKAAFAAYREAVEGAIALKTPRRTGRVAFLPDTLEGPVEPLMKLTGVGLAGAARRLSRVGAANREADARWLLEWSTELDPEGHAARLERAEALVANGWIDEALAAADAALASTKGGEPVPRRIREEREWLALREKCLLGLGKLPEAEEVVAEILKAPPRRPGLSPRLIDLSKHYTASLYDGRGWHSNENLRMLPETFRPRGGIDFDIRGLIQLQSGRFPRGTFEISGKDMNELYGKSFPEAVKGIQVGLRTKALHFLTAGSWCMGASVMEVSRIVIHYEDGDTAECPIRFREDVIDWSWGNNELLGSVVGRSDQGVQPPVMGTPTNLIIRLPADRIAWMGGRPIKRLMRKTWTNPHPDKPIREIDFVSAMSTAAPFLVAVTAE